MAASATAGGKTNNGAFLTLFWDLASDERDKRLVAAQEIIAHIKSSEEQGIKVDTDYTLKRLVRGLGSSRESARQGFVTCLCELLEVVKTIDIPTTLTLIDEHTKVMRCTKLYKHAYSGHREKHTLQLLKGVFLTPFCLSLSLIFLNPSHSTLFHLSRSRGR